MTEADREHFVPDAEPVGSKTIQSEEEEEETEDEEVKMTCFAGLSGMRESDLSSESDDTEGEDEGGEHNDEVDDDDDDDDKDNEGDVECQSNVDEQEGLVEFVSGQVPKHGGTIHRPTPMIPKLMAHEEESEGSSSDSEESRSVNARGEHLSLTTGSSADSSSDDEEEQEEEEIADDDEQEKELAKADGDTCSMDGPVDDVPEGEGDDNEIEQGQEDETENEAYAIVGASGASVEDLWSLAKQKRVLSSNALNTLNREAGILSDVSKRLRSSPTAIDGVMPELSLGLAAYDQMLPLPRQYLMRGDSPYHSSDEEGDKMLSEELEESPTGDYATSPIPLLTPPQSPRRECVLLDDENASAVEWPSNLVVDSAMMIAVTDLRPLSPASLQDLEEHEEERLKQADTSSLTPLLRSISVGNI